MNFSGNKDPVSLLKQIVAIPSVSGEEALLCSFLCDWMGKKGFEVHRKHNNFWIRSEAGPDKPLVLLNSHMDTVKPVAGWTRDPFLPEESDGKLYGLGCSDAGGCVTALMFAFIELASVPDRDYNLVLLISAEEESSGKNGIESVIPELGKIDLAIVGEPTNLNMAVCERGLVVLDCFAHGKAGHVAHRNGENAITKAMRDIAVIEKLRFDRISDLLGEVQLEVTQIEGGYQHNVIPDLCKFVVDVRTNEKYSNTEVVDIVRSKLESEVVPRSLRLHSSSITPSHPLVKRATELGIATYGSKTMSDQALIPAPSVKIGPGRSELSHKADEYIEIDQITKGIELYINILKDFKIHATLG